MRRHSCVIAILGIALVITSGCGSSTPTASVGSTPATAPSSTAAKSGTTVGTDPGAKLDAEATARFQRALDDTRATGGFPGVIAGVWSPEGTWVGTSGTIGKGMTGAPTANDRTRVGSLTKTMTATIVLQLMQEKKLSLDETIGTYVPGMPNGDTATLRQLLDMTSGIDAYTLRPEFQDQLFGDPTKAWTPEQLVAFEKGQPAKFAPGKGWQYSNTNYVLLGMVIEKVTGKAMPEVFQERIFGPLGMTSSVFPGSSNAIGQPHLSGLTEQGQPTGQTTDATDWNPSSAFTAGEVISTVDDLKKWADALFTGKGILDPATQQLRRDSIIHDIPPNTATAGYGFGIGDRNGWWGHDGQIPGYTTNVMHNYATDTTIIVVANSDIPVGSAEHAPEPAPAVSAELVKALG